ncbi:MAG: glycoside hydrolase family 3 protein [Frankia sp.]|nr:glycoside hydrolase family 3 protein [Frankia sp.]
MATRRRDDAVRPAAEVEERVAAALARLDLAARVRLLTGGAFWRSRSAPEVGLREMVFSDGPAGVRGEQPDERAPTANLPCPTALAATWDEALLWRVGQLLAADARAKGVHVVLGPTVNLHRSPRGGRHFECLSEDPLLTGRLAGALVRGIQDGGVAATVKHYVGNDSETDRFTVNARIDERTLREVYLAPFESLVTEAGAWAVMAAYNAVNGTTMTESPLLRSPLADEWGFDGLVVTDWYAARSTVPAALAGLDLVMPGPDGPWGDALLAAVTAGEVPAEVVEEKARRLLRLAARVGALGEQPPPAPREVVVAREPAARDLIREAAAAGMVLLRNEAGLLPLAAGELRRVAVIGPNADQPRWQGGGSAGVIPPHVIGPAEGLRAALGDDVEVIDRAGVRDEAAPRPLTAAGAVDPLTGEPGLRVRYLDAAGAEVDSERRLTGQLLWTSDPRLAACALVEVSALVPVTTAGPQPVGFSGMGRFELRLRVLGPGEDAAGAGGADGERVLFDGEVGPPDGDLVRGFLIPPNWYTEVDAEAGQRLLVTLRFHPVPGLGLASIAVLAEPPITPPAEELAAAVELAASADVAVVVVGTSARIECEGVDRTTLALPPEQDELVRRVAAANPRTVVVVNAGAPVLLPWRAEVPAVLLAWFPGQELGAALADVLLGRVEPGGRLPTTWPASEEDCPVLSTTPVDGALDYTEGIHVGYRGWARRPAVAPAYPFGHGLGYTTWSFAGVVGPAAVPAGSPARVTVTVHNTGQRPGRVVVQAYLSRPASAVERPVRWLAGFATADAVPGQTVQVSFDIAARAFQHWVPGSGWATEPGTFELALGPSSAELPLRHTLAVAG